VENVSTNVYAKTVARYCTKVCKIMPVFLFNRFFSVNNSLRVSYPKVCYFQLHNAPKCVWGRRGVAGDRRSEKNGSRREVKGEQRGKRGGGV